MKYVIISNFKDDDEYLYWSNADGWGDRSTATVFTEEERRDGRLPADSGGWVWLLTQKELEKFYNSCPKCGGERDSEGWCASYCMDDDEKGS